MPFGIVDLAAIHATPEAIAGRLTLGIPPVLYEADAAVVMCLTAVPKSEEKIARELEWPVSTVQRRLRALKRRGAVIESKGRFTKAEALRPIGSVIAVEAKVRDWRRALDQALTYGLWCDRVAVSLAYPSSDWEAVCSLYNQAGVGLAIHDRWAMRPRSRRLDGPKRLIASECIVAAILGTN